MGKKKVAGPGRLGSMSALKKSLKGGQGNPNVRTIPTEDSLTVRFLQEPEDWYGYYEHWLSDGPVPCTEGECDGCDSDDPDEKRRSFRYLANAFVVDDQKVRVLKLPKSLVELLVNFYNKYGTLLDRDYDLSRTGSGQMDTKYMAAPDSKSQMKLSRFKDKMLDLGDILLEMANSSDDDDDDDEPVKSRKTPWDDDDDDDEPAPKKEKKKSASGKKPVSKKSTKTVKRTIRK